MGKKFSRLFLISLFITNLFSLTQYAIAETAPYAWSKVTPNIDGVMSDGEWSDAYSKSITLLTSDLNVIFYIKNDDTNLYIGVKIKSDDYFYGSDMLSIRFDNNNNGEEDQGEDLMQCHSDGFFVDNYLEKSNPDDIVYRIDKYNNGNEDGFAAYTHSNPDGVGDYFFEFSHPLDSDDDDHDFSLKSGDYFGISISYHEGHDLQGGGIWPGIREYFTIQVASEPDDILDLLPFIGEGIAHASIQNWEQTIRDYAIAGYNIIVVPAIQFSATAAAAIGTYIPLGVLVLGSGVGLIVIASKLGCEMELVHEGGQVFTMEKVVLENKELFFINLENPPVGEYEIRVVLDENSPSIIIGNYTYAIIEPDTISIPEMNVVLNSPDNGSSVMGNHAVLSVNVSSNNASVPESSTSFYINGEYVGKVNTTSEGIASIDIDLPEGQITWYATCKKQGYASSSSQNFSIFYEKPKPFEDLVITIDNLENDSNLDSIPFIVNVTISSYEVPISNASVRLFLNEDYQGAVYSDEDGHAYFTVNVAEGNHKLVFYAVKSGHINAESPTINFSYKMPETPEPELSILVNSPINEAELEKAPFKLNITVISNGSYVSDASVRFYVDEDIVGTGVTLNNGVASTEIFPPEGTFHWYVFAEKTGYLNVTSSTYSFTYSEPEPETPGGIPGFPVESLILSILLASIMMWMMKKKY